MEKRQGEVIFSDIEPYVGLKSALAMSNKDVIEVVRNSNLRGRGGAGFPTGLKWSFAESSEGDQKFIVCNADEGEPGTFKDQVLLDEYIKLIFEGMAIAGYAIGADKGILYLRGEYKSLLTNINKALDEMKNENALGENILGKEGFNFNIEIRLGAGAYVCGEETALIESLEGNRGEPRNRPPYPVNTGYFDCPTSVNNCETFCIAAHVLAKGADWFKAIGTEKSAGTKLLSISGDCSNAGVYEVAYGISIKEVLELAGASDTKAVQVGGASGVCIGEAEFDRKIAFEDLATGGSIIIFNKDRNLLDVVENFMEFFQEESCGQCTPCREGIPVVLEAVELLKKGKCTQDYLEKLISLSETVQIASKCGLGQSCVNTFLSVVNNFKDEYELSNKTREEISFNG
jgi:[NiFe] hydrogenase diaphorase moiety large subunit